MNDAAAHHWTALLGRRDQPVDGVRDYCRYLADALAFRGIQMTVAEAQWAERGWLRGLIDLWGLAGNWKGSWVIFQYTALSWSRRGFPLGAAAVMVALRLRGCRTAVMFHDWTGYTGPRLRDRVRWRFQRFVMHRIASLSDRCILPVPPERAPWLRGVKTPSAFIAIGANMPIPPAGEHRTDEQSSAELPGRPRTVAVFCVTDGPRGPQEVNAIAAAVKRAAARVGTVRLVVFGRGSVENRSCFERALNGSGVDLCVLGLVSAEEAARELSCADAALFVRGEMEGQRGSAIASIACGTPLVGFGDSDRAFPLNVAGVLLVPKDDGDALADALARVLTDDALQQDLRERNRHAQEEFFSWNRIAERFVEALADARTEVSVHSQQEPGGTATHRFGPESRSRT